MRNPIVETEYVRWMIRRDLPDVLRIDAGPYAPTEADFLGHLRRRNCIGMVLERDDAIVGYMLYELHPDRLRLLTLAIAPGARRTGAGRRLVAKLVYKLCSHRRLRLAVEVPEAETGAQLFFRACGFRAVGVLRGPDGDEYEMEYRPTAADWDAVGGPPGPEAGDPEGA